MKVSDLMTQQVATIRSSDSAATAARLMWDCDCGSLPVVDENNQVSAVVTDRDICMTALFEDRPLSPVPVSQAMSKSMRFCAPDDSVSSAEQIMRAYQIRRLPVLDAERRLLGILSLADIVRATEREKGRKEETIADDQKLRVRSQCLRPQARRIWAFRRGGEDPRAFGAGPERIATGTQAFCLSTLAGSDAPGPRFSRSVAD